MRDEARVEISGVGRRVGFGDDVADDGGFAGAGLARDHEAAIGR